MRRYCTSFVKCVWGLDSFFSLVIPNGSNFLLIYFCWSWVKIQQSRVYLDQMLKTKIHKCRWWLLLLLLFVLIIGKDTSLLHKFCCSLQIFSHMTSDHHNRQPTSAMKRDWVKWNNDTTSVNEIINNGVDIDLTTCNFFRCKNTMVSQKFCNILELACLQHVDPMIFLAVVGSIMVVGVLTCYALLHSAHSSLWLSNHD